MRVNALRLSAVFTLLPLPFALSACVNLSGLSGDSKYACKAPAGVACDSVSGTYANAIRNNLPNHRSPPSPAPRPEATPAPAATHRLPSTPADDATPGTLSGPIRSQARVLRLWIKPWEDTDGDLYDQGYVYVQVDNGQWLIDHVQRQIRDAYAPLRPPPRATDANKETATPIDLPVNNTPLPRPLAEGTPFPSFASPANASNRQQ